MAAEQDFICDVSGRYVSDCDPPVLVYLVAGAPQAALPPGQPALDVTAALEAGKISPFLAALLRRGRLELSAEVFDQLLGRHVDMVALAPAFVDGGVKAEVVAAWNELRALTQRDDLPGMVAKVKQALRKAPKKGA